VAERRVGRRWTEEEVKRLRFDWGEMDLEALARRLGRTPAAVTWKAQQLGLGPVYRGTHSLFEISRITGYDRGTIRIAAARAGVPLRRAKRTLRSSEGSRGRRYAIPHEHYLKILEELAKKRNDAGNLQRVAAGEWGSTSGVGEWGTKQPGACLDCGTRKRPRRVRGRCRPCYDRLMGWTYRDRSRRLKREDWDERSPPHCVLCERTDRPHASRGRCKRCYDRVRWHEAKALRSADEARTQTEPERGRDGAVEGVVGSEADERPSARRASDHGVLLSGPGSRAASEAHGGQPDTATTGGRSKSGV
jgi:hypothetical protein